MKVANAAVEHYSMRACVCVYVVVYVSKLWLLASNRLPTLQPRCCGAAVLRCRSAEAPKYSSCLSRRVVESRVVKSEIVASMVAVDDGSLDGSLAADVYEWMLQQK